MCKIALQIANWYEKKNIYLNAIFVPGKLNGRQRIQTPNIYRTGNVLHGFSGLFSKSGRSAKIYSPAIGTTTLVC
jgi:hypothetical protein